MHQPPDESYEPGDIVVTLIPTGYLIGQAIEPIGPGPGWTYIAIVSDLQDAIRHARVLARQGNVRAWFSGGGDTYQAVPLDDSSFADTAHCAPGRSALRAWIALDLYCAVCAQPVTVELASDEPTDDPQTWTCPACAQPNTARLSHEICFVRKRQINPPKNAP